MSAVNHQHHPDELTDEQRDRMCPSCRIRYRLGPPGTKHDFNGIRLSDTHVRWLENAARAFVEDTDPDDDWTAVDFIAWIKPDLTGRVPEFPNLGGRPIDYDDERHIKDRERQRERRRRAAA